MVGLLLLLLFAVAFWWVARTIFLPPQATPTPSAMGTPGIMRTPALAAPAAEMVSTVTPSPTSTPAAKITVGQMVRVSGTEQEGIRFRTGPGLSYITLDILKEGTKLKVLEGPEEGDGYLWWRLVAEDGTVGWAAQDWLRPVAGTE